MLSLTTSARNLVSSDQYKKWTSILVKFASVQLLVQFVTMVSGFLLIHRLNKSEYAYFTIFNSLSASMIMLANVGVDSAVSSIGGTIWQDREKFGSLIVTAMNVRRILSIVSAIGVSIAAYIMLRANHATPTTTFLLIGIIIALTQFTMTYSVLSEVPKLHGKVDRLQKLDLANSLSRCALVIIVCFTFANAVTACAAALCASVVTLIMVRPWAKSDANLHAPINNSYRQKMWQIIGRTLPGTLYYCFQGQITIFILGAFGKTSSVADIGALGRLSIFFSVLSTIVGNVIMPRFARCQDKSKLKKIWLGVVVIQIVIGVVAVTFAKLFPGIILWVLGAGYNHLADTLFWVLLTTSAGTVAGTFYLLVAARAWTKYAWMSVPIAIAVQVLLLKVLNLNNLRDVILFGSIPFVVGSVVWLVEGLYNINKFEPENPHNQTDSE